MIRLIEYLLNISYIFIFILPIVSWLTIMFIFKIIFKITYYVYSKLN